MMQVFFSASLSFAIHILFVVLIILSTYTMNLKKTEEVRVTLIDITSPRSLIEKELPDIQQGLNPQELPKDTPSNPPKATKAPKLKTNKEETPKELYPSKHEEELLSHKISSLENERLEKMKEQQISEDDLAYLKDRLSALKGKDEKVNEQSDAMPTPSPAIKKITPEYLLLVKRRLQTNFEVPIHLRSRSGLRAKVQIETDNFGKILAYAFLQHSGSSEFDRAIERCLKLSNPLPVDRPFKIIIEFTASGIGNVS